jgi:hypothetical protein
MAAVMLRVEAVRQWRASRDRETTRKLAQTPTLFAEIRQPTSRYVAIPTVSSERRNFIPMGLLDPDVVASNQLYVVPDATLFHFGILSSTMHNAWVRAVCGRLESRYRYSAAIVYNNFPWPFCAPDSERNTAPALVEQAQSAIEKEAKAVLDARAAFPGSSLADLYDPLTMPPALLRAHQKLDAAGQGLSARRRPKSYAGDAERVAFLFTLYQRLTSLLPAAPPSARGRARPGGRVFDGPVRSRYSCNCSNFENKKNLDVGLLGQTRAARSHAAARPCAGRRGGGRRRAGSLCHHR